MNLAEFLGKIEPVEPLYVAEDFYGESFITFMYRFQSLHRYWEINRSLINSHILMLRDLGDSISDIELEDEFIFYRGEIKQIFSETAEIDIEYFPEYIRASTISFALSLVENFLLSLSEEVAEKLGVIIKLEKKRLPYITKYILWLTQGCGIEVNIDDEAWRSLEIIRKVRNNFVHKIDKDIPEKVRKVVSEMVTDITDEKNVITDELVDLSLRNIANLVKTIELAIEAFYKNSP